jgi:hypothetical protein
MRRKGVTLFLLWQEYKEGQPDGFLYSWFCVRYREWLGKLDAVMRQEHLAGEKCFVDYCCSLREARATGNYARRFQTLVRVSLLIIDDFGLKPLRSPEDEDFHDLIAERYERTATILTSNLDFDEWGEAFAANKMIGSATLDRLRHGAYRVILDGDSYRDPKPVLG